MISVKAFLVDAESRKCLAQAFYPKQEAPILSTKPGWAEQSPSSWLSYLKRSTADMLSHAQNLGGWDFTNTWNEVNPPTLKWQTAN